MDMRSLAREILLYDRLVLPVPEDLDEADRWDGQGWDTNQLDYVAKHLGDLAHLVPWSQEMRSAWKDHMSLLAAAGVTSDGAAYGATPTTMVGFIWDDVAAHQPRDALPPVPPRIVAAYLSQEEAAADFEPVAAPVKGSPPAGRRSGILLTQPIEVPRGEDDEDVFLRAVRTAREPEFASARRALYDYEDRLVMEDRTDADIVRALGRLLDDYTAAARDHAGKTKRQWVSRLIAGGGGALANSQFAGAGKPVSLAVRKVFARFPSFVPGPDPAGIHPGEALTHVGAGFPAPR
ncbi:hypothetical protein D0Z08_30095 [Nocardioides immobilis]|uniref:Uncharacterized protein n=2 Tax=Nocardioides immobilis TaxID=2049295 RepID=A0A417XSR7_9ACTN|nr:hypothetical protein D0Z08_30095 [Nocardioides immobilis]